MMQEWSGSSKNLSKSFDTDLDLAEPAIPPGLPLSNYSAGSLYHLVSLGCSGSSVPKEYYVLSWLERKEQWKHLTSVTGLSMTQDTSKK